MDLPDRMTQSWLDAMVPGLRADQLDELLGALRRRGWSEEELGERVLALREQRRPSGAEETVVESETVVDAETVVESAPPPPVAPGLAGTGGFAPGTAFGGYVIENVAGRGGMGVVYRARQVRPSRIVALKVISPDLAGDEAFRQRFARESEVAASIEHSNVIPVYEVGDQAGLLFIVMRYVEGTDLQAVIAEAGRLEPRRAVDILAQVTSALDAAHARGLVHRDVKPANVLLAQEGGHEHVYLTDFGLAKSLGSGGVTRTGMFVGTVDYAAPEQFEGDRIDARTDVYAAGCMLYHALAGDVPFPADSEAAKMRAHLDADPPSVRAVDPALPAQLDAVIHRAMAKNRDDRYLSAGDFGRAALAAVQGRRLTRAERSVATGEAAPGAAASVAAARTRGGAPGGVPRWVKLGVPALAMASVAVGAILLATRGGEASKRQPRPQPLAACLRTHGLASPSQVRAPRPGESALERPPGANVIFDQRTFATCASSRAPGANPDGYRAITVTEVTGPGVSEASGQDVADRIESRCRKLELAYSFGSQGAFARIAPFRANAGEIWTYRVDAGAGTFSPASPIGLQLPFYPLRNEVDVLRNFRTRLDEVTCIA